MRRVGEDGESNSKSMVEPKQGTNLRKTLIHGDKTKRRNLGGYLQFL